MTLLDEMRAAVEELNTDPDLLALRFRLRETWSDGTECRFGVQDPNRGTAGSLTRVQADPLPASLRLLRVHPADPHPETGASTLYQGGRLVLGPWGDESDLTGQAVGICRLVDARAYPTEATTASGAALRLRIVALDAPALGGGANDLAPTANNSHRAHLPPGVQLQPGETLTTQGGDRYLVVPPVQRDALGDVVGLSWQGSASGRTPTPANDPTPEAPPVTPPRRYDPWWDES